MADKMGPGTNALNWFEISVTDMERAKKFYQAIFGFGETDMMTMEMAGQQMSGFPGDAMSGKVGGALVKSDMHTPSADGTFVYLNGNPDLSVILDKVGAAGGKVAMPKTQISPEIGYMGFFIDSEGNRVGLHSVG